MGLGILFLTAGLAGVAFNRFVRYPDGDYWDFVSAASRTTSALLIAVGTLLLATWALG